MNQTRNSGLLSANHNNSSRNWRTGSKSSQKFLIRVVSLWNYYIKVFGSGTKLVVTDKGISTVLSPHPTIFLPSKAEVESHSAGTYLCLLENFFPDVIKIDWKEKTRNKILESQQGNTIKTNDKFMKFSWLTVTGDSLNKEHQCVVKHESIRDEKVILFPSINKMLVDSNLQRGMTSGSETQRPTGSTTIASALTETGLNGSKQACLEDEHAFLKLQFTNTSAYYTYFLLLLKNAVYLAIIMFCLLRRPGACADGKTS